MSRMSAAERLRYAAIGPSAVIAMDVGQHSQTRESISVSPSGLWSLSNIAARSCMSPSSPCVVRPSSQTIPRPPYAAGNSDANPCCETVLSRFGARPADHILPSAEKATRRLYASGSGPLSSNQCAANEPSGIARTEGTSAAFTIRRSLEMTTAGVDHPEAVRSANLSVDFFPSRSTQLITMRSPSTVICGTELEAPAGDGSGSTESAALWAWSAAQAPSDAESEIATNVGVRRVMADIGLSPHLFSRDRRRGTPDMRRTPCRRRRRSRLYPFSSQQRMRPGPPCGGRQ